MLRDTSNKFAFEYLNKTPPLEMVKGAIRQVQVQQNPNLVFGQLITNLEASNLNFCALKLLF